MSNALESIETAGWGFPGTARKCHYFPAGSTMALCAKWGFFYGHLAPDTETASPDDCVACRRKLEAQA